MTTERKRLEDAHARRANWQRWGPYLAERQWGTVREDYSASGDVWGYFTHDQALSRAYRWGEDGLLGITDRECRLCFALALWNGRDPILKERLYGLTGPEGNHGEDVKECYFYLDSTPTHSYMKGLYKYPHEEFPYAHLVEENHRRTRHDREFELTDTGVFDGGRYFDVLVEYAKNSPNDILIMITATNRGPETRNLHLLPTLWFRNTWSWGCTHEGCWIKPRLSLDKHGCILAEHSSLGRFRLATSPGPSGERPAWLFTENETNAAKLFGSENASPYVKDAIHEFVVHDRRDAVNPQQIGTKASAHYVLKLAPGQPVSVRLRLHAADESPARPFGRDFDSILKLRQVESDEFYGELIPGRLNEEDRRTARQAYAGLFWSKQFYHYVVDDWLQGDPDQPAPPAARKAGRNSDWPHLFNRDIISMPDKWEYPWFAAWDLAFHAIAMARADPQFAKDQLLLFLREWYMHPNGQIPAYEFNFADVNPPVHAWACWRVYKMTGPRGQRDRAFLERAFPKLLVNFTWWVNRKDLDGKHLFAGGFLGLDNIGVFDRSRPLPSGGALSQADGTAWMAFYCATMLSIALELAESNPVYEDIASKFFEHFVHIADAINNLGGTGLWDEQDGFYYDLLQVNGTRVPLRIRSMVGLIPLLAVEVIEDDQLSRLPGFRKRLQWFLDNRKDLGNHISYMVGEDGKPHGHKLLAIPSRDRLERVLRYLLDEDEFLSPYGIRSLSRCHGQQPFTCAFDGQEHRVAYLPGESDGPMFGGNSNWRGPIWIQMNYLLIEALQRYHHFYGDDLKVECPRGSGTWVNLREAAAEIGRRNLAIFLSNARGRRPWHGDFKQFEEDVHWHGLTWFFEYFDAETGRGLGASHQTGWTALIARLYEELYPCQAGAPEPMRSDGNVERKKGGPKKANSGRTGGTRKMSKK